MTHFLRTFDFRRALLSALLLFCLYVFSVVLENFLANIANAFIADGLEIGTALAILNIVDYVFIFTFLVLPPVFYFIRSQSTFRDGALLSVVLVVSLSLSDWIVNLYRTLSNPDGVVYGGGIGSFGFFGVLIPTMCITMGALYLQNRKGFK